MSRDASEFGRGFATCLIQFTNHRARLEEDVERYVSRRMPTERHPFTEADAVELWANGATDHLYELIRPTRGIGKADWQAAKALQDRALDIGHGYSATSKSTPDECRALLDEAARLLSLTGTADLEAALAWDAAHGLTPEKGTWSCAADLSRSSDTVP